ncbi:DUF4145 domain-containing protein [Azohydromonas caseinilytica]|uniref:DUF4145 domain-containing protein n=1 Tax=Azohydromonas caseinilytica TaxID=2728836 RepID=UPI00197B26A5|nr:DUF4145 domain-containing protein [Azohydromonas caseinilytica]
MYARQNNDDARTPNIPDEDRRKHFLEASDIPQEVKPKLLEWCDKILSGSPFFEDIGKWDNVRNTVENLNISECYNCKKIAVWVHKSMVYPETRMGPKPNVDLPTDILRDYEEARSIVNVSPRGAAALLRLAVQKLCAHLGERGKNIDEDIASLVGKGLDPLVQQALDIVRVIGNEAVHPGTLDIRDDQNIAIQLCELVNLVCQQIITQPKAIRSLYDKLPEGKRTAIESRNAKALNLNT